MSIKPRVQTRGKGVSPWNALANEQRAIVDSDSVSRPKVFPVKVDLVLFEQRDKFIFERLL